MKYPAAVGIVLALLTIFYSQVVLADPAATYQTIKKSVGLVLVYKDSKIIASGTAFCVGSDDKHSLFLTNRHVIAEGNRYFILDQTIGSTPLQATLMREGTGEVDAAILRIDEGSLTPLTLSATLPEEGTAVAVAGYPLTQLSLAEADLGLSPSVHAGTVNALPGGGFFIQFDAQLEPGNSGGPLYDPESGIVYGVATLKFLPKISHESNGAISIDAMRDFLTNAHVAYSMELSSGASAQSTPSACGAATRRLGEILQNYTTDYSQMTDTVNSLGPLISRFGTVNYHDSRGIASDMVAILDSAISTLTKIQNNIEPSIQQPIDAMQTASAPQTAELFGQFRDALVRRDASELTYLESFRETENIYATTGKAQGQADSDSLNISTQAYNDMLDLGNQLVKLPMCKW